MLFLQVQIRSFSIVLKKIGKKGEEEKELFYYQ